MRYSIIPKIDGMKIEQLSVKEFMRKNIFNNLGELTQDEIEAREAIKKLDLK
jgi:hypothetical protein